MRIRRVLSSCSSLSLFERRHAGFGTRRKMPQSEMGVERNAVHPFRSLGLEIPIVLAEVIAHARTSTG